MTRDAETIAFKLGAEIKPGRKHARAVVRVGGVLMGQFGIRHGSEVGHDYIPNQIQIPMREAIDIARCHSYFDDYVASLRSRKILS